NAQISTIAILLAGSMAVCALLISKISMLLPRGKSKDSGTYECGFDGSECSEFTYVSEHNGAASLFIVVELAVLWLSVCCLFFVIYPDCYCFSKLPIKILALVLTGLLGGVVNIGINRQRK
ncbi:MAG: hypothetical protein LBJ42_00725, partial [Holosporales bacterium]|nr:hypothetical protein [Holosporales bacterium]